MRRNSCGKRLTGRLFPSSAGPGCLNRLRLMHPAGRLRFFFDEEKTPRLEMDAAELANGKIKPFVPPLAVRDGADWISLFPLPFAHSLRLEMREAGEMQIQAQYRIYPEKAAVRTFALPLPAADKDALDTLISRWERPGKDPRPVSLQTQTARGSKTLAPGEIQTIATLPGPALLTALHIKIAPVNRFTLRQVLLRVIWDDAKTPAIEAPLGDFFGAAFSAVPYTSLPAAVTQEEFACFWPMPFRQSARIQIENRSAFPLSSVQWNVSYRPREKPAAKEGYFTAQWRHESAAAGQPITLADAKGRGHLVGMQIALQGAAGEKFLDAQQAIRIDGADSAAWSGAFGETYPHTFADPEQSASVMQTCTVYRDDTGRIAAHRFAFADALPFQKSLRITLNDAKEELDCASVVYLYSDSPEANAPLLLPSPPALPHFHLTEIQEAENLAHSLEAKPIDDTNLLGEASGGKVLAITGKDAAVTVNIPAEDVYNIGFAQILEKDASTQMTFRLNDEKPDELTNELALTDREGLGKGEIWLPNAMLRLKAGKNIFYFEVQKGQTMYLDYLRLQPSAKLTGVVECESLLGNAKNTGKGSLMIQDGSAMWSGWSGLLWQTPQQGDMLELPLDVPADGDYTLDIGMDDYTKQHLAATTEIRCDEKALEAEQGAGGEMQYNYAHIKETLTLTAGTHRLTFRSKNGTPASPTRLLLDYLRLNRLKPPKKP